MAAATGEYCRLEACTIAGEIARKFRCIAWDDCGVIHLCVDPRQVGAIARILASVRTHMIPAIDVESEVGRIALDLSPTDLSLRDPTMWMCRYDNGEDDGAKGAWFESAPRDGLAGESHWAKVPIEWESRHIYASREMDERSRPADGLRTIQISRRYREVAIGAIQAELRVADEGVHMTTDYVTLSDVPAVDLMIHPHDGEGEGVTRYSVPLDCVTSWNSNLDATHARVRVALDAALNGEEVSQ